MAARLDQLLGMRLKQYGMALTSWADVVMELPSGMWSYDPTPAAGVYATVVDVTGAGRLRGVVLRSNYLGAGATMTLRVTIDGFTKTQTVTIGSISDKYSYVMNTDGIMGRSGLFCLLPEWRFGTSLKIEVARSVGTAPITLYELHEMEV